MKALVLEKYNQLVYMEVPRPTPGKSEVLIRIKACGICGSDVHGMDGSTGRRIPPIIMGHEASGVIEEIGEEVTGWKPGDRVTFDSTIYSLDDWYTKKGMYNLSDNRQVLGVSPGTYCRQGAFADYVTVPEHVLYRVPQSVSFEEAAMVEPVAVSAHAVNLSQFEVGDTAVIVGAGMIGVFLISMLKTAGLSKVIAVDIDDEKKDLALQYGASMFINASDPELEKIIQSETDGRGVDLAIEAVGVQETIQLSIRVTRKGGCVTLVGNNTREVAIPLQEVVTRQINLQGSCAICGEYKEVLELMEKGVIDVKPLISIVAPLEEGADWFDRLYQKEKGLHKVILVP